MLVPKLLIKYPTRNRPELFQATMKTWIAKLSGLHDVTFLISIDDDDWGMQLPTAKMAVLANETERVHFKFFTGKPLGKIAAMNRDMEHAGDFDILILAADDMIPQVDRYDEVIFDDMAEHYPDGKGALWYNDGMANHQLCTLSIMTKELYDHFGYIYHPAYHSMWCDNEFMDVCKEMGCIKYLDKIVIKHEYKQHGMDETYKVADQMYDTDRRTYLFRKESGWPK